MPARQIVNSMAKTRSPKLVQALAPISQPSLLADCLIQGRVGDVSKNSRRRPVLRPTSLFKLKVDSKGTGAKNREQ